MSDKTTILAGLIVFVVLATSPIWYSLVVAGDGDTPKLEPASEGSRCVMENPVASHMDLLDQWRDEVIREGNSEPVKVDGRSYKKSLTEGCLRCHSSRKKFCQECHGYANVAPPCWNCHLETKGD